MPPHVLQPGPLKLTTSRVCRLGERAEVVGGPMARPLHEGAPRPYAFVGPKLGAFAAGSTLSQIHIPESACPGTPQMMR